MILTADTARLFTTKLIDLVLGFAQTYWKYYNMYNVFIVNPYQMVYTNSDWTEKREINNKKFNKK